MMFKKEAHLKQVEKHKHGKEEMTLIQIAISLASITVLTRTRRLFAFGGLAAQGGLAL